MPIPLLCATCDHVVGADNSALGGLKHVTRIVRIPCPGRGKHLKPVVTKESPLLGGPERTTLYYPETDTRETIDA